MEPTGTEMTSDTLREASSREVEEESENTVKSQEMEELKEDTTSARESGGGADPCKSQKAEKDDDDDDDDDKESESGQPVEGSEDTFKKPVFISKLQRQANRSKESRNTEEKAGELDPAALGTHAGLAKSPAQQLVEKSVPLPYKEPAWSGLPSEGYSFEVVKNGIIVEEIPLKRPFIVMGRLQQCDVVMQHPSLSRYHCVVQYRAEGSSDHPQGFYGYDLGSTHGSYHNKHRMKPLTYYHLRVGHILKLGGSTRMLVLQGPNEDQEEETKESASELMAAAAARKKKLDLLESGELDEEMDDQQKDKKDATLTEESAQTAGIDWGMGDDAQEEGEDEGGEGVNPFASLNEEVYVADPKKTLRGWLEREGYDLPEYQTQELGRGSYSCSVELPVAGPGGGPLVARVEHKGRKKDAVVQCAREACRLLDKMGVLRQAKHESLERRRRDWAENDYYDSDEDDFLDRTGDIQRKRIKRMEQSGSGSDATPHTYQSLWEQYQKVTKELSELEERLTGIERVKGSGPRSGMQARLDEDDLDSFMQTLKADVPDKHKRVTWKLRVIELRKEELKLRRLTNVARPPGIPEIPPYSSKYESQGGTKPTQRSDVIAKLRNIPVRPAAQPKEPTYQVHKIFLEEEPEYKPRLRRLDDGDDRDLPKPQPYKKTDQQRKTPGQSTSSSSSKNNTQRLISSLQNSLSSANNSQDPVSTLPSSISSQNRLSGCAPNLDESQAPAEKRVDSKEESRALPAKSATQLPSEETNRTAYPSIHSDKSDRVSSENEGRSREGEGVSVEGSERDAEAERRVAEKRVAARDEETRESGSEKKGRILGPTLPPHLAYLKSEQEDYSKTKKKKNEKQKNKYDEDDPNYIDWVPPVGQTGDGRTSLNQKLGY